jgi:hypothetical protein
VGLRNADQHPQSRWELESEKDLELRERRGECAFVTWGLTLRSTGRAGSCLLVREQPGGAPVTFHVSRLAAMVLASFHDRLV